MSSKPITAYLFYSGSESELAKESDLIMDIPGGGFICMNPEHHAERLLRWAKQTGKPVISFDYGKVSSSHSLRPFTLPAFDVTTDLTLASMMHRLRSIHSLLQSTKCTMPIVYFTLRRGNVSG